MIIVWIVLVVLALAVGCLFLINHNIRLLHDLGVDLGEYAQLHAIEDRAERKQRVDSLLRRKLKERMVLDFWDASRRFEDAERLALQIGGSGDLISKLDSAAKAMLKVRNSIGSINMESNNRLIFIELGVSLELDIRKESFAESQKAADLIVIIEKIRNIFRELGRFRSLGEFMGVRMSINERIVIKK